MQALSRGLRPNPYVIQSQAHPAIVTVINDAKSLYPNRWSSRLHSLEFLRITPTPSAPPLNNSVNVFQWIDSDLLGRVRKGQALIMMDWSWEGYDPVSTGMFDALYASCGLSNIDPQQVIYATANLKDPQNLKSYNEQQGIDRSIRLCAFPSFETLTAVAAQARSLAEVKQAVSAHEPLKLFSSLSRVDRRHRALATFMLCQRPMSDQALISHSATGLTWNNVCWDLPGYTESQWQAWCQTLPRTIDRNNFDENWAWGYDYNDLHDRTVFHIANETHVDDWGGHSLFYSEKTYRPMINFQPFVIYGQPGANHRLEEMGYKTYKSWFDLSFDWEPNPVTRYQRLLNSIEQTANTLAGMTNAQQLAWRFKDSNVLMHNHCQLMAQQQSRSTVIKLLDSLDPAPESC